MPLVSIHNAQNEPGSSKCPKTPGNILTPPPPFHRPGEALTQTKANLALPIAPGSGSRNENPPSQCGKNIARTVQILRCNFRSSHNRSHLHSVAMSFSRNLAEPTCQFPASALDQVLPFTWPLKWAFNTDPRRMSGVWGSSFTSS